MSESVLWGAARPQPELIFVLDIESIGLHGESFAYGWTVIDEVDQEVAFGFESIHAACANGSESDRLWVGLNVLPVLPLPTIRLSVRELARAEFLRRFRRDWMKWQAKGATLWADCGWPVEANFLSECNALSSEDEWISPYPFHEIATALQMAGMNPLETYQRLEHEKPKHNPLADARQFGRLLMEAKRKLRILS